VIESDQLSAGLSDRLIDSHELPQEERVDRAIRPARLSEYVGQPAVCEQMNVFIEAAQSRGEAFDIWATRIR
jgi:Holliday junction DNA helicase RuvB